MPKLLKQAGLVFAWNRQLYRPAAVDFEANCYNDGLCSVEHSGNFV